MDKEGDLLTLRELREFLKIGRNLAYELIHSKQIKAVKVGRSYRIYKNDVVKYLKALQY